MLQSTQGLVLHTTNYSETSIIAKVFTRELGLRSYIFKGVRSAKSYTKQNLLQPLSYLAMVVYNNPKSQLNYVKEIKIAQHFNSIAINPIKGSLLFFMNEMLYKTLQEDVPSVEMFDYVVATLNEIEQCEGSLADIPLRFMLHLAQLLGIVPMNNYSLHEPIFNLQEGRYQSVGNEVCLSYEESLLLHHYLVAQQANTPTPIATLSQRNLLIDSLLEYYRYHLTGFRNFHSHEILHAVLQ